MGRTHKRTPKKTFPGCYAGDRRQPVRTWDRRVNVEKKKKNTAPLGDASADPQVPPAGHSLGFVDSAAVCAGD